MGTEVWSTEPPAVERRSLLLARGEVKIFYTVFYSLGDIIMKSKLCSDSSLGEKLVEFNVLLLNCLMVLILRDPFLWCLLLDFGEALLDDIIVRISSLGAIFEIVTLYGLALDEPLEKAHWNPPSGDSCI